MRTLYYELSVEVPDSVTANELRQYVREAVAGWGGQRHPDDHLFGLRDNHIRIRSIRAPSLGLGERRP